MGHSNHGIIKTQHAEEQPADKERAQKVHKTGSLNSVSREATRDPKLNNDGKTPGSGTASDDSGDAPTG
jgi:hypothetical protein